MHFVFMCIMLSTYYAFRGGDMVVSGTQSNLFTRMIVLHVSVTLA